MISILIKKQTKTGRQANKTEKNYFASPYLHLQHLFIHLVILRAAVYYAIYIHK